jgi:hypothetical protein
VATVHSILTNFTAGELSPRLYGRVDIAKYQNGARDLTNFQVLPQGGARKRGGTKFIAATRVPESYYGDGARLVEFTFSTTQSYILEFGHGYIRFFKDQGQIYDVGYAITAVVRGTATIIYASHTFHTYDRIILSGLNGCVELNNREFVVSVIDAGSFYVLEVDTNNNYYHVNSNGYGVWTGGGAAFRIYEIYHSYAWDVVSQLTFTQSADTLFIFHHDWPIHLLTRSGHAAWSLRAGVVEEGPFLDMNDNENYNVSVDVASGVGVMTFNGQTLGQAHTGALFRLWEYGNGATFGYATWAPGATVIVSNGSFWEYGGNVYQVVGGGGAEMSSTAAYPKHTRGTAEIFYGKGGEVCSMRYEHSGYCVVQVLQVVNSQQAWVQVVKNRVPYTAYGARSTIQWQEGAWSDARGYPAVGTFHEQRLVAANTEFQPSTVWGSQIDAYLKFKDGDKDDEAYTYTISSDQVDAIKFMASTKRLALMATGAEYIVQATSTSEAITPTNIKISRETSFGTSTVHPVRAGPAILFAQRAGVNTNPARRLREFVYNFQTDSYLAPDLTILSDHITFPGLVDGAFCATPDMLIWYARADGMLIGVTYERDQQVVGWHKHPLGGNGAVRKTAAIPGQTSDELWMIVDRYIPAAGPVAATRRYVEIMTHGLPEQYPVSYAWYLDGALAYQGAPTYTVSGLWHLNGLTVSALCDGIPVHNLVVTNGRVFLPHAAGIVIVGFSYQALLKTLHIEAGAQSGTAQGRIGRVYEIIARLQNSVGGKFGMDEGKKLDPIKYREGTDTLPPAIGLFNGDKVLPFDGDWDRDRYVTIQHDEPLPFTVTALMISQRVTG